MKTSIKAVFYAIVIFAATPVSLHASTANNALFLTETDGNTPPETPSGGEGPKTDSVTDLCPIWPGCIVF